MQPDWLKAPAKRELPPSWIARAARAAAGLIKVPYLRFTRPEKPFQGAHIGHLQGWPQAVDYLKQKQGRALLTIGVRRLHLFAAAGLDFAVRVLPNQDSLDRCLELGIGQADIIAAQPPHSVEFNRECIRRSGASVLVSKDSGREGGLTEKAKAAGAEGIELLLIDRPRETGALTDLDELVAALAESIAPPAVRTKTGNDVYNDSHSE
jgi:precorrin-6x reductase